MTMSVDGLISGMDTTSLVSQLMQAEAAPQTALKIKLSATQTAASAYRTVNTTFAAVRAAAESLTASSLRAARTATSSLDTVTASAGAAAVDGSSVSFRVTALAKGEAQISAAGWAAADSLATSHPAFAGPLQILDSTGAVVATISPDAGDDLTDVVAKINDADAGVRAAVVKLGPADFRLQVTSTTTGAASSFTLKAAGEDATTAGSRFKETQAGQDSVLEIGSGLGITAKSSTNTFTDLLPGLSVTVTKEETGTPVTITVGQDAAGVAAKMQGLVDAVNSALTTVKTYTSSATGSTAPLKGDFPLTSLAGRLLDAASAAVGADGSPVQVGLQLTRDGKLTFDKGAFTKALTEDPDLVSRMVGGTAAADAPDGVAVPGLAGRLFDVAKAASDTTTGSIVALAKGQDTLAADIKERIENWDLRLALRKQTLTRQFTAMETALSSLRNQSTWLAGQLNSLPSSA